MNILHIVKKYPPATGGDAVVVGNLVRQQQAAGHNVTVVTSRCTRQPPSQGTITFGLADTPPNLDAITLRRMVSLIMLAFGMFGILRRTRPDIIHTHSVDMAFFASLAARWYRIPIVHTFHIVTFYDQNQPALRRKTELWLAKNSAPKVVTAPNQYDTAQLLAGGLSQTICLPNGVDLAFWDVARQPGKQFTFVSVGRLEAQKGYSFLITAAATLAQQTKQPFQVIAIGSGAGHDGLQRLAKQENAPITFVGRKTAKQVRDILSKSGCLVIPSLYETTPLTLLEGWAAGIPVIATPVGILRTASPSFHAAYIVPPQDAQALAAAMGRCMQDAALRTTLVKHGRREAAKYVWPDIAQSLEALYRSAL